MAAARVFHNGVGFFRRQHDRKRAELAAAAAAKPPEASPADPALNDDKPSKTAKSGDGRRQQPA